jgi:hypothetical protein
MAEFDPLLEQTLRLCRNMRRLIDDLEREGKMPRDVAFRARCAYINIAEDARKALA